MVQPDSLNVGLKALRSIRGMWKGKAKAIMQRIEAGREDRSMPAAKH